MAASAHQSQFGLQVRYALQHVWVNSIAESLPPRLLRALVDRRVWLWSRAVAFAARIPDASRRALAFAELADSSLALDSFRTRLLEDASTYARLKERGFTRLVMNLSGSVGAWMPHCGFR